MLVVGTLLSIDAVVSVDAVEVVLSVDAMLEVGVAPLVADSVGVVKVVLLRVLSDEAEKERITTLATSRDVLKIGQQS